MKSENETIFSKSSLLSKNQRPKNKGKMEKNLLMILNWKPERRLKTKDLANEDTDEAQE